MAGASPQGRVYGVFSAKHFTRSNNCPATATEYGQKQGNEGTQRAAALKTELAMLDRGEKFRSRPVAQLAERRSPKPQVGGSIPSWPASAGNGRGTGPELVDRRRSQATSEMDSKSRKSGPTSIRRAETAFWQAAIVLGSIFGYYYYANAVGAAIVLHRRACLRFVLARSGWRCNPFQGQHTLEIHSGVPCRIAKGRLADT